MKKDVFLKSAKYLKDHVIRIVFTDGSSRDIDFHDFLAYSRFESERRYLDLKLFKAFHVNGKHDLIWGDFDLCIPLAALRAGDLEVSWDGLRAPQPQLRPAKKSALKTPAQKVRTAADRRTTARRKLVARR